MKCFLCVFLLLLIGCHGKKISFEEKLSKVPFVDLHKIGTLIHHMMTGDYFACTLFGYKPMTFQEFHDNPWKLSSYFMLCPYHHFYIDAGWETWVKYRELFPSKKFIFAKIPSKVGYKFIILINKIAFEKMFDENRDIFEQALGPRVSLGIIFQDFERGQKTFSEVLNEHEGLVGLVLGYGREASLLAYRDLTISNHLLEKSLHPLAESCEHHQLLSRGSQVSLKLREKKSFRQGVKWHQFARVEGLTNPYEQLNNSEKTSDYFHAPNEELFFDILPPNFTCMKNSKETDQLRNDYSYSLKVARDSFRTKSFLRGFLEQYCEQE